MAAKRRPKYRPAPATPDPPEPVEIRAASPGPAPEVAGRTAYLTYLGHAELRKHYVRGSTGTVHLLIDPIWGGANLPLAAVRNNELVVQYYDQQDGHRYVCPIYTAWDMILANGTGLYQVLAEYFYSTHHCPCHRKQDVARVGAITDTACEGNRFLIERITAPAYPDLVLYSEIYVIESLEAQLAVGQPWQYPWEQEK